MLRLFCGSFHSFSPVALDFDPVILPRFRGKPVGIVFSVLMLKLLTLLFEVMIPVVRRVMLRFVHVIFCGLALFALGYHSFPSSSATHYLRRRLKEFASCSSFPSHIGKKRHCLAKSRRLDSS